MSWTVKISRQAQQDLDYLRAYDRDRYLQALVMTRSIEQHPESGVGAPHHIVAVGDNVWCRNICLGHRVVYELMENTAIIAAYRTHVE